MSNNGGKEISFVDIGKVRRLLGLRCIQCVKRGLRVVVIVGIWKHIVRIGYKKTETVVKQVVGKRTNKKRYLCPLPVSLPSRVDGLYSLRSSHEGCCGKLSFFYTRLTKH